MNEMQDKGRKLEIGKNNFEAEVLHSKLPVLVAFVAPWSRPCRVLESVLDGVVSGLARGVRLVKINADDNPDVSLWYGIRSIPTLLYFADGIVRARIVGTASEEAILAKLNMNIREQKSTERDSRPSGED